ncbi:MAG: C69 family dipeptidase [Thermoanaerobaculales bacterium]|jgi:dipeptidase|nr:C69 family dipeptidase [Thermoanaerobaculales bacterium]
MRSQRVIAILVFAIPAAALLTPTNGSACTNILVTKGASADGSTMITYACDGRFHPRLENRPAADHEPGSVHEIRTWSGELRGTIPQVAHTHAVVGLMNEHQLAISETTTTGREELENPDGLIHYWTLMELALERATTAREAIDVMTSLVAEHGYRSTAESFSIADPNEVWLMEMIGTGPGGSGAVWVAMRIPDGFISAYANAPRIRQFPLDDPTNCLYSDNVISFAVERGFYHPESGEPFDFAAAYDVPTPQSRRYTATRVWSIFRRAAPSLALDPAFHRGDPEAEPYPLWIEPEHKLTVADVMALMRDHYEGTDYDMTSGVDAGPFGTPNRWRPMTWTVDGVEHTWERPISTQQTGFSFVSQSRSWLPDAVGGVFWYGLDDTSTSVYVPLYAGITRVPESYTVGSLDEFSWDSAWWVFNFVANIANLKYSYMIEDIRAVQGELEGRFLAMQPVIEKAAVELAGTDPELMRAFLTQYSVGQAEEVVRRWKALGEHLLTKYNDGYVAGEGEGSVERGYPESWLREVVRARPDRFRLEQREIPEDALPY